MIDTGVINFYFGEVVPSSKSDTYKKLDDDSDINNLFEIDVQIYHKNNTKIITCKPINGNIKQIPFIGESVLIFQGYDYSSSFVHRRLQWYYFPPINIQSSTNTNVLPVNSEIFTPDPLMVERIVAPMQPYRGDILYEGRYGNSIRFSSTVSTSTNNYSVAPSWTGTRDGDPIIILSNSQESEIGKKFIVENLNFDYSSLYLTSTQTIPTLTLGDANSRNPLSCFLPNESQFAKSQFIGTADRVILKAKTDIAVIDSPRAIILNTTGDIKLGNDEASSNMVHGDVLLNVLQKILNQLSSPIQCGTMVGTFIDKSSVSSAQRELKNLLSQKYYLTK
jgi:hypothetical protein